MKSCSSREVLSILKADGWYEVGCDGDYHQFKHSTKKGKSPSHIPEKTYHARRWKAYSGRQGSVLNDPRLF